MIILSAGMPRAGSGWFYNLTHDLMVACGSQDARYIRDRYHLKSILTEVNCNIGALTLRRLTAVMLPSILGNTFVIKTHAAPTLYAQRLINRSLLQPTYIYRDPRDAMLSAFENGQRAREADRQNAFSNLIDFDTTLQFMMDYLRVWESWMQCKQALKVRYEDFLFDYSTQTDRLLEFLNLNNYESGIPGILDQYLPKSVQNDQRGLHFSRGITGRFRQVMTADQQDIMAETFAPYLERMGYEPV
ncbi:sulfotransferase domain-containing protein [Chloroflexota bacterium]